MLIAALMGCTASSDATPELMVLPLADAQRARELTFLSDPPLVHVTRAEFAASAEKEARERSADDDRTGVDTYARLGFYPRDIDKTAAAGAVVKDRSLTSERARPRRRQDPRPPQERRRSAR